MELRHEGPGTNMCGTFFFYELAHTPVALVSKVSSHCLDDLQFTKDDFETVRELVEFCAHIV